MAIVIEEGGIVHRQYYIFDTSIGCLRLTLNTYSRLMGELGTSDPLDERVKVRMLEVMK